jgi:dephospho-CoA kinase
MQSRKRGEKKSGAKPGGAKPSVEGRAPLRIGLTGNIGSGKSTAALIFAELGAATFDTDKIGHELLQSDPHIQSRIVETFGNQIIVSGLISRQKLGKIVFGNPEKRKKLESILHPAIMSAINQRLKANAGVRYAVVEVPLLYEARLSGDFDYVILVKADRDSAVGRASTNLGISKEEVLKRLEAQIPQLEKEKLADFVIANDGTRDDLKDKIGLLHTIISSLSSEVFQEH